MRYLTLLVPIVALVAAIAIFYSQFLAAPSIPADDTAHSNSPDGSSKLSSDSSSSSSLSTEPSLTNSITTNASSESDALATQQIEEDSATSEDDLATSVANLAEPNPEYPETYGYEIANTNLNDEEIIALVERLKNDPYLLNELLNELRAETDPARIKRLTALLGGTGSAQVLAAAEELALSSVPDTQAAGLDLLSRVATSNPEAYDIAVNILSSSSEPKVLVSTMNVLATPRSASAETKSNAITQIMPLTEHESAAVRRHSVSLLPRLTNDAALSPILYNALADTSADVRSAATYAYASYPFQPPEAVERLLQLTENPDETNGVRRGAIYALQKMSPDEQTLARISAAKRQMREAALAAQ